MWKLSSFFFQSWKRTYVLFPVHKLRIYRNDYEIHINQLRQSNNFWQSQSEFPQTEYGRNLSNAEQKSFVPYKFSQILNEMTATKIYKPQSTKILRKKKIEGGGSKYNESFRQFGHFPFSWMNKFNYQINFMSLPERIPYIVSMVMVVVVVVSPQSQSPPIKTQKLY